MSNLAVIRLIGDRLAWYPPEAGENPLWLDEGDAVEKLRAVVAQRRYPCCFAAPGEEVRLLTLTVSAAEKKHLARSLPFTLEEQVAQDIDELHFASCPLQGDRFAVAVCSRDRMADWQERLDGLPAIGQWLPEPLLLPWREGEWCLVIEGDQLVARTDHCGGFAAERGLAGALLAGALSGAEPERVIVYGRDQDADTALLPAPLRDRVQWRDGNFYTALLLADDNLRLNLRQGDYAMRLPLGRWWLQWRAVAAVFAVAFVLQVVAAYADYRSLQAQNLALRGAVQQSYRKAYPQGAVVDAEKQLRRQLDGLRGGGQGGGFTSLMAQVGGAVAALPGTSIASINYSDKGDSMRLNITAANFETVENLRSRINEAGLEAVMESSSAQGDKVRARLRVGARS